MEKRLALMLPKKLLSDEKRDVLETLFRYIKNDDEDIEIYLREKIKNCISEEDIVELSNFINDPKINMFVRLSNKETKILNKVKKLISDLYIFRIREDGESRINASEEINTLKMFEYVEGVYVFFSDRLCKKYNVDNVYDELYKDMIDSKDVEEKAFLSNVISNLNILRNK